MLSAGETGTLNAYRWSERAFEVHGIYLEALRGKKKVQAFGFDSVIQSNPRWVETKPKAT